MTPNQAAVDPLVERAREALLLVFEESLFLALDPLPAASPFAGDAVHTWVAFHGPFEATLHLRLPWALAEAITADFLGEGEPDEEMVLDACCEAANMVAGRLVKALSPEERRYTLEIPAALVEEAPEVAPGSCAFTTGEAEVHLWLTPAHDPA